MFFPLRKSADVPCSYWLTANGTRISSREGPYLRPEHATWGLTLHSDAVLVPSLSGGGAKCVAVNLFNRSARSRGDRGRPPGEA